MSSSGAGTNASDPDAALALLSGPDIVAHLQTTFRKADYDAAARVLGDRDRWLAEAEANAAELRTALVDLRAEVQVLKQRYLELKAKESRGPSGAGAMIAAAPPPVGRRGEEPGLPEGAVMDLCSSDDDDDDELEEGEFRPAAIAGVSCKRMEPAASKGDEGRRVGVSCQQQESASKGEEERTPAGVSCKRKAPASACSPDDDEDDRIPLSLLFLKKPTRAQPGANGKPNKGHEDAQANSAGLLVVDRPAISPGNRGIPEAVAERMVGRPDDPKVAAFVQGTGNGQSRENGGQSRTMPSPPPTGSTAGNSPRKNCSKPDGSEGRKRIGEKQGRPVARPENDAPLQVRAPSVTDTARRIVGSARVGAETPMEQEKAMEKANGVHKTKVVLETNGTGNKASTVLKDTREQGKPDRPTTSDKLVSTTLQPKNQLPLHSEQISVESSLPSEVTRNWKSSSAVFISCLGNKELCMQAACALHRQIKFTTQQTVRGINKYDAHRVAMLAQFLLDGNLQGPLKRTAEDLEKHDPTGHDVLERIVLQCSEQLFSIYRNKNDKYFR